MLDLWFNPFDALGLDASLQYSRQSILAAHKIVALICHPDKRSRHGLGTNRWPQFIHVQTARDVLTDEDGLASAYTQFKSYPRTFFPREDTRFRDPDPSKMAAGGFGICPSCMAILKSDAVHEHLSSEHELKECQECLELIPGDSYDNHLEKYHTLEDHTLAICPYCGQRRKQTALDGHIRRRHTCGICSTQATDEALWRHLLTTHMIADCDHCLPRREEGRLADHVRTSHPYEQCPCGEQICRSSVLEHLEQKHGFRHCNSCTDIEEDHAPQWDVVWKHVLSYHPFTKCGQCGASFCGNSVGSHPLHTHLLFDHILLQCSKCCIECLCSATCDKHPGSAAQAWEHISEDHAWMDCSVCYLSIHTGTLPCHLSQQHSWISCHICADMYADKEELITHLNDRTAHVFCTTCNRLFSQAEYPTHLRQHDLVACQMDGCGEELAPSDMFSHFKMTHDQTVFCSVPGCPVRSSETGAPFHLVEDHFWRRCSICNEPCHPEEIENHGRQKHDLLPCPECQSTIPLADMDAHRTDAHNLRKCPFCGLLLGIESILQHIFGCSQHPGENVFPIAAQATSAAFVRQQNIKAGEPFNLTGPTTSPQVSLPTHGLYSDDVTEQAVTHGDSHQVDNLPNGAELGNAGNSRQVIRRSLRDKTAATMAPCKTVGMTRERRQNQKPVYVASLVRILTQHGHNVFEKLRNSFRQTVTSVELAKRLHCLPQENITRLLELSKIAEKSDDASLALRFCKYRAQLQMADTIEIHRNGRLRVDSDIYDQMATDKEGVVDQAARKKFSRQVAKGRKIRNFIGMYPGILCLVSAVESPNPYFELKKKELGNFHSHLQREFNELLTAGAQLLNSFESGELQDFSLSSP